MNWLRSIFKVTALEEEQAEMFRWIRDNITSVSGDDGEIIKTSPEQFERAVRESMRKEEAKIGEPAGSPGTADKLSPTATSAS